MPEIFSLQFPQSLGVFDAYADAQKAVDYLSDEEFPVENCLIVGTDLKQVERVTGRLTTGRVAMAGAASGAWLGLLIGLLLGIFAQEGNYLTTVLTGLGLGVVFGVVWALIGYCGHPGPARLQLGHQGRRHPLRGAGRAQAARPGPGAARQDAGARPDVLRRTQRALRADVRPGRVLRRSRPAYRGLTSAP